MSDRIDPAVALALAIFAAVSVQLAYARVSPDIVSWQNSNYWFDSDAPLVYGNMTNTTTRWGDHSNTRRHPLFVLISHPITLAIQSASGADARTAVGWTLSGAAALAAVLLFALLRTGELRPLDGAIFTSLAAASAGSVFWFAVPETYPFAAVTILASLLLAARADRGHRPPAWLAVGVAASTLAVTSTNWLVGLFMLAALFPLRKAALLAAASFGLVLACWLLQRAIAPSAAFFIGLAEQDARFFFHPEALGSAAIARAFFFHSLLMPELQTLPTGWLSVQAAALGSGSTPALIATPLWLVLLVAGARRVGSALMAQRYARVLVGALAAPLALHLVFGRETFLYALHYAPLLVAVSAFAARGRERPTVLVIAALLTVLAGWNNIDRFREASASLTQRHTTARGGDGTSAIVVETEDGEGAVAEHHRQRVAITLGQAPGPHPVARTDLLRVAHRLGAVATHPEF